MIIKYNMTIEEKARRYNEALSRAKAWVENRCMPSDTSRQGILEDIFPELKESEDEKVRKALIEVFSNREKYLIDQSFGDITVSEALTWLKKQGEQKPTDKVEPKFNVGDWIVFNGLILYINEVVQGYYRTISIGGIPNSYDWNIDNIARLWTIQDAKDGDVLCDYHETYDNPLIFILKKFEHVNFGLVRPSDYSSYCFLTAGDIQRFKEGTYHHKHNIKPATKEQRDFLFSKMKEAGYEWDAEKKELKLLVTNGGDFEPIKLKEPDVYEYERKDS